MRVLVTGGAGFLGSHLCDKLIENKHDVICLDNLFTGSKNNISHLFGNAKFEFIRHDIIEPILLEVDWIFNLACPASPIHYQHNPVKTVKTSVVGTLNMLGLAKRVKARIFQASTSEVYGDPAVHPQSEEYWGYVNPVGIRSCYDESKRTAETLMTDYHRQNGVDIRILRIFNTYGPRMSIEDGRVVSNFIVQSLRKQDITIYGDGKQTRCFCYVSDMIEAMISLMNSEDPELHTPVNAGNEEEISMLDLVNRILKLTGEHSNIKFEPLPSDDPVRRKPDCSKIRRLLKWHPVYDLDDGLLKTIEYFRNII